MPWIVHKELGRTTFGETKPGDIWFCDPVSNRSRYSNALITTAPGRYNAVNDNESVVPRSASTPPSNLESNYPDCYLVLLRWRS